MITLQTVFGCVNEIVSDKEMLVKMLTENPRKYFQYGNAAIKENAVACLTLFDPSAGYIFEESMILSKSKNSAFIGKRMKGKVIGIINKHKSFLNT